MREQIADGCGPLIREGKAIPLVSVVVPNYNHGKYLRQRLDSILNQTFRDFELIVLDDASTDDSRAVIEQYRSRPAIQCLFNERNTGRPSMQWEKGIHASRGRYVWVAESDDWADVRFLETLVPILEAHPDVGLVYCRSMDVDMEGFALGKTNAWFYDKYRPRWEQNHINNGRDECLNYMVYRCVVGNASAALFRRDVYDMVGGVDVRIGPSADWDLWVRMLSKSNIACVAEILNYYRSHARTTRAESAQETRGFRERYQILGYCFSRFAPDKELVERGYEYLFEEWFHFLRHCVPGMSARERLMIAAVSLAHDRRMPWRYLRYSLWELQNRHPALFGRARSAK